MANTENIAHGALRMADTEASAPSSCGFASGESTSCGFASSDSASCEAVSDMPVSGTVRRLDPRASFLILILLNIAAFAPTHLWIECMAVICCAAVMCWCRRTRSAMRWCAAYAVLFVTTILIAQVSNPVTASFAVVLIVFRRVFCVGMFGSNLIATTRVGELACALTRAHVPRGIVVAVSVGLRFFPTIATEFQRVIEAMRVRGIRLSPVAIARNPVRVMEHLFVPVMSRFAIVADELGNAAVVRGIDSSKPRTSYYDLRIGTPEVISVLAFAVVAAQILLVQWGVWA